MSLGDRWFEARFSLRLTDKALRASRSAYR
jgi:hypothetical protein